MTPTEVTTSVMMCRPSATSAGERSARPVRIRICAQTRLITDATPLMARPVHGWSSVAGAFQARATSARISSAATTISTPSSTAEKYSALWWPNGWSWSAGVWLTRIAQKAAAAAITLTVDSSASE